MHLNHKIPWDVAARQFVIVEQSTQYTPPRTDVIARKSVEVKRLRHLSRVVAATIQEFAATESEKHEKSQELTAADDELFSDAIRLLPESTFGLGAHDSNSLDHNPISDRHQSLQYWINRANDETTGSATYTTSDADLADVVTTLIQVSSICSHSEDASQRVYGHEAFAAVLRLAQHPHVPLHHLENLHWGHSFGV
ncbi:hypothetical protein Slin15195_G055220 [Septoria linicola]|uniref:Uncharacterized protein n=1 Tax=Septoria linicola TaxID=215465 RepID=A0A9Q9EKB0_9PEZI|nr:hypothetical protein Slin14017_G071080 [Septoria linicola]USW52203.1 hypothetical protein Slin15195_G055220 [Septoria linicola]